MAKNYQDTLGVAADPHVRCTAAEDRALITVRPTPKARLEDSLARFQITEKIISDALSAALSRGGEHCDLYFEHRISNNTAAEDSVVNRAYRQVDFGVGVRVVQDGRVGYSYTEEITPRAIQSAGKTAARIASVARPTALPPLKITNTPHYYPTERCLETTSVDERVSLLKSLNTLVYELDGTVIKCSAQLSDETRYLLVARSDGQICSDCQPMTTLSVRCVIERHGSRENGFASISGRYGVGWYNSGLLKKLAQEATRRAAFMFDAKQPAAGQMEVVLAPGTSGILLHEAIGHSLEADFIRSKTSIFADRVGTRVSRSFVSIVDDGTYPNLRGTINVDDEGNISKCTCLVEKGILAGYLHDQISAAFFRTKPTGNGRRESFRSTPMPRMRNTYMLPGPHKRDEIVQSVKKGLYAADFTNGEVLIGAGDFSFFVNSGYLIEDGKLTQPVKNINLIGNGPEVLRNITMVADDLELSTVGATCVKEGQGVPVQMGLPTVKVPSLTVGGILQKPRKP
jgi:TldD protein